MKTRLLYVEKMHVFGFIIHQLLLASGSNSQSIIKFINYVLA